MAWRYTRGKAIKPQTFLSLRRPEAQALNCPWMCHQWKISEKKCLTCKCTSVWHVGRILILKTILTITWKSMIMDLELWGALPANSSWWWTVMIQQVVQAALHLGSPTGYNSLFMCYSVATYTPLFLEKSVLVAGINIHWLIDWSRQTFVQKWLLDYGHFYGQIWPFLNLMAIFIHQTMGRIVRIRPIVAHGGEEDSHKKNPFVPLNFSMCH